MPSLKVHAVFNWNGEHYMDDLFNESSWLNENISGCQVVRCEKKKIDPNDVLSRKYLRSALQIRMLYFDLSKK